MFDFVDNQVVRIILEIAMEIITGIFGFLGGVQYSKKKNIIKNVNNSNINQINQVNK